MTKREKELMELSNSLLKTLMLVNQAYDSHVSASNEALIATSTALKHILSKHAATTFSTAERLNYCELIGGLDLLIERGKESVPKLSIQSQHLIPIEKCGTGKN